MCNKMEISHASDDYDGLYALAKRTMKLDPLSGNLFAFIKRCANQIKVLCFDRSDWCVWAKRLEQGRLLSHWNTASMREMDWTGLKLLLEGIEPKRVRLRYQKVARAQLNVNSNTEA